LASASAGAIVVYALVGASAFRVSASFLLAMITDLSDATLLVLWAVNTDPQGLAKDVYRRYGLSKRGVSVRQQCAGLQLRHLHSRG
jgi:hypothetical protein